MHLRELLSTEDGTEFMIYDCLQFVRQSKGVVAFGAGVGGQHSISF